MSDADSPIKRALVAIDKLRAKLDRTERERKEPIAIVGAGCRLPGGVVDLASLSARLQEGFDAIVEVPADRWDIDAYYSADPNAPGKMNTRVGGFLTDVDEFDAAFFGLSAREAASLDPQHRLMLEVAWEALEDAGHPPAGLRGSATGVFIGLYAEDYAQLLADSPTGGDAYAVTGGAASFAAGRLSFLLDLRGPAVVLDTVCSSSLVAIDAACQSLRNRRCDLALAGAVSLMLAPSTSVLTSKLFALSPTGRCHTFDAAADGYVRGEGCAAVVLKRLSDAVAGNDRILGVIRGSAVNHDGHSTSFTAPNVLAQRAVIQSALEDAGVTAAEVSYVEAHGTGTPLGDPIEIDAIKAVLGGHGPPLAVGSVKTNFGHLESAAGMAGLLKVLTCFAAQRIPPHLHLRRLNPHIDLTGTRVEIPTAGRAWPRGTPRRIAGISSFGLSGTNAHVVVEEPPEPPARTDGPRRVHVLPLSARSEPALRARASDYAASLPGLHLEDATYSAGARREHHEHRLCVIGESAAELADALRAAPTHVAPGRRRTVFVYSGQGSQWIGMGRVLLREAPAFAERMAECDRALADVARLSVIEVLSSNDHRWQRVEVIQPLLFAMQVSLSALWRAWGVEPDAVVGHSLGEVAASVVAGTLSLEDGARVMAIRSRLVSERRGGRMALIELSPEAAREALPAGVSLAAHHGPDTVLVSGDEGAVRDMMRAMDARGVFSRLVDVDYASHSPHMDGLLDGLAEALRDVRGIPAGRVAQCSTVLAKLIDGPELDGRYWCRNLRDPVRFHESIEALRALGHDVFLEVSPHPVLVPALSGHTAGSTRRDKDELRELSESLARLYTLGVPIDWARRHAGARPIGLPAYPWQRQRHWVAPPRARRLTRQGHAWLERGRRFAPSPEVVTHDGVIGDEETAWLRDHVVQGEAVVPAALWIDAALQAAREAWGSGPHAVREVELLAPLVLGAAEERVQLVVTHLGEDHATFVALAGERWSTHARGKLVRARGDSPVIAASAHERWGAPDSGASFYAAMRARGLSYGPRLQLVRTVERGAGRARAQLTLPSTLGAGDYVVHPALLDGCLQALAGAIADDGSAALPVGIDGIRVLCAPASGGRALARVTRSDDHEIAGDVTLYDADGSATIEITGLRVARRAPRDQLFAARWEAQPALGEPRPRRLLVIGGDAAILARLAALTVARCAPDEDVLALLRDKGPIDGIVYLSATEPGAPADAMEAARTAGVGPVVRLVRALAGASVRLWIVTRHAQPVGGPIDPTHAALWGLGRTLLHEHPELRASMVDVGGDPRELEALAQELALDGPENHVALRGGERWVARVGPTTIDEAPLEAAGARAYRLESPTPGVLDRLELRAFARRRPGPGEVEIEIDAGGINFLDVLHAMGVYPGQAKGPAVLGHECAGRVTAVGAGVSGLGEGDEVIAIAQACLATHTIADARLTVRKPARMSMEGAAGAPLAYLTAHYGLLHLARLAPGETVLVHSASGGVGLAAIAVARRAGAEVFATAGTDAKRAYLRELGVSNVMSSRTLAFADDVRAATGGRGVDVVLNSLTGEAIDRGLSVLAPYGRFIEIGKKDIYDGRELPLSDFRRNLTYAALDVDAMVRQRPELLRASLLEIVRALDDGSLPPLPVEASPIGRAAEVFRTIAAAEHVGKRVLVSRDRDARIRPAGAAVRADASYLITGGLGGLGLTVARWLVAQGARRLVLLGRHARAVEDDLGPAHVEVVACDVTDGPAVARVIRALAADPAHPLRGVVHAAGVLDDGLLVDAEWARIEAVMAPKVRGAQNLDAATEDLPLDLFVMFSSAASLLGSPAQGSYAAANAYLDALAHHRRQRGLAGSTIQWGAWAKVGLAARRAERGARLAQLGMASLDPSDAMATLGKLLAADVPEAAVIALDAPTWCASFEAAASTPYFSKLAPAPAAPRAADLSSHLVELIAKTFRLAPGSAAEGRSIRDLGGDSLTALELKNRLAMGFGVTIPAVTILGAPSVAALVRAVEAALPQGTTPTAKLVPDPSRRHEPFPLTDI